MGSGTCLKKSWVLSQDRFKELSVPGCTPAVEPRESGGSFLGALFGDVALLAGTTLGIRPISL